MNYYDKNIECIKKNRDYLYKSVEKVDILSTSNRLADVHSVNTKDGEQAVVIKIDSTEYRLNSMYHPIDEAKRWAEQYKFHNLNNVIAMFGFGNGIFARAIIEKMGDSDTLLIYEPSADIFFHVISNYDITDILTNARVSISIEKINEFEFHNLLQNVMNITNVSSRIMCEHPQYKKIFVESCLLFWKELKDSYLYTKININTQVVFGKKFIDNALNNTKFLKNSNTLLELKDNIPKDIPAIVVAAGPSVEKQIEELKRAKGRAVIIAVERILDCLLDLGLEPDFVVTLDPMKPVKYFSRRLDVDIPLICFLEANQEILERHIGRKIICNCSEFLNKAYIDTQKDPPQMNSSTSVATVAFTACIELGFKRIILVGQDLAYDGTQSHSGKTEDNYRGQDAMVEDINGKLVKSRFDWKQFITWYQDTLTVYPQLQVIDAKEKGARIKGTTVMPLKEAIDLYCSKEFNCDTIFAQMEPTFNSEQLKNVKNYLENNMDILEKVRRKSIEAGKLIETLIKGSKNYNLETNKARTAIKKLGKINRYIAIQPIYTIIDTFVVAVSAQPLSEMYHFTGNIKEDRIVTYEKSKYIFEAITDATGYIKPRLEEAINNLI